MEHSPLPTSPTELYKSDSSVLFISSSWLELEFRFLVHVSQQPLNRADVLTKMRAAEFCPSATTLDGSFQTVRTVLVSSVEVFFQCDNLRQNFCKIIYALNNGISNFIFISLASRGVGDKVSSTLICCNIFA